ncbi:hypothetical protein BDL97_05G058900 [Sphagnum fallax]|nr:hypothetical protein BDL97_05G058900 [Sphagnum fallax]
MAMEEELVKMMELIGVSGRPVMMAMGVLLALLSAVANGSFTVIFKTRYIRRAQVSPLIFSFWASLGVVISSLLVLFNCTFVFNAQAVLSGFFFVLSFISSFKAVRILGISVAFGIWAGTSVLVSHLAWKLVEARGGVTEVLFAAVAFLVTLAGIVGVAWSGHMERVAFHRDDQMETLLESQPSFAGWLLLKRPSTAAERLKLEAKYNIMPGGGADPSTSFSAGVFSAVFAGAVCALAKMPETQVPASEQGLAYLPSFAIAVMINTSIMTALPYLTTPLEWPDFATYSAAGLGILSGILWNIGNMLSIVAVSFIGRDIAYSIFQCAIIIAGLWGMILFDEINYNAMYSYWASVVVLLIGVVCLSLGY